MLRAKTSPPLIFFEGLSYSRVKDTPRLLMASFLLSYGEDLGVTCRDTLRVQVLDDNNGSVDERGGGGNKQACSPVAEHRIGILTFIFSTASSILPYMHRYCEGWVKKKATEAGHVLFHAVLFFFFSLPLLPSCSSVTAIPAPPPSPEL